MEAKAIAEMASQVGKHEPTPPSLAKLDIKACDSVSHQHGLHH